MKCGTAVRCITPARPMNLAGYGTRIHPFDGIYHDIYVRAMAIESGQSRVVFVVADVLFLGDDIILPVQRRLDEQAGLEPAELVFLATHTHTAPAVRIEDGNAWGDIDLEYVDELREALFTTAKEALESAQSCTLTFHRGTCDIGINRRVVVEGAVNMWPNPDAVIDRSLDVLVARDPTGEVFSVFTSCSCHPVTTMDYEVGADFPGYMRDDIEEAFPGSVALFAQGSCGDINPTTYGENGLFQFGDLEKTRAIGHQLARSVLRTMDGDGEVIDGPIRVRDEIVEMPFVKELDRENLEQKVENPEFEWTGQWASETLALLDRGESLPTSTGIHMQFVRIGPRFTVFTAAGELCSEIGLNMREIAGNPPGFVLGYASFAKGYLPSNKMYTEGGYEVFNSFFWEGLPAPYAPGIEDRLLDVARKLTEEDPPT
jgi:neutral ceramidase